MKTSAILLIFLLAGCGKREMEPNDVPPPPARSADPKKIGPDEHGVVCYVFEMGIPAIQCVKVR